jgi:hypothetical protein
MRANHLNAAYKAYLDSNKTDVEPLLSEVRIKAFMVSHDEDVSQTVAIDTWRHLPALHIKTSFSAWVKRRIKWRNSERFRMMTSSPQQIPTGHDDEGSLSDDEIADILLFNHSNEDSPLHDIKVDNPFLQRVADFLLLGHSQQYIAKALDIEPSTLRKRIERYRNKQLKTA